MKCLVLLIVSTLSSLPIIYGQDVFFQEDPTLSKELNNMISKSYSVSEYQGWQIQFFYTDNRREFDDELNTIRDLFPEYNIEWQQKSPYYYIYGGAYLQKLKALQHLNKIKQTYPSAILTRARISKQEISSNL